MPLSESVLFTSIPPSLKRMVQGTDFGPAWQAACVRSWKDAGFRIVSLNTADEVSRMHLFLAGVEFFEIPEDRTRPLIAASFAVSTASGAKIVGIINADCLLIDQIGLGTRLAERLDGIAIVQRFNIDQNTLRPTGQTCFGFDAFFFTTAALSAIEPDAMWRIGDNWWDYWLPMAFYFGGLRTKDVAASSANAPRS
jgi:hypothetical protein